MTNKQVEEIVREGKKEVEEYYSHRLAMHEGRGYMHTVVNMEVFEKWLTTALAERDREIVMAVKGVRDTLEVSLHNAVNDQRAPYRHAIQAIDEEILALLTPNRE